MYEETFLDVNSSSRLGKAKGTARREDVRMCIAHIMRLTALGLPSSLLASKLALAASYRSFLTITLKNVSPAQPASPDTYWENQVSASTENRFLSVRLAQIQFQ